MPRPHPPDSASAPSSWPACARSQLSRIADDLGLSESCLRGWVRQADIDDGRRNGLSRDDRNELAELRRELRVTRTENQILKRWGTFSSIWSSTPARLLCV